MLDAWKSFRQKAIELNKKGKGLPGAVIDAVFAAYFPGYPIIRKLLQNLLDDDSIEQAVKDELVPDLQEILQYEKLINDRHKIDMESDSWLSKNIRPMTLGFLVLFTATVSVLNSIFVPSNLMKLIESTNLDMKVDISMLKGADRAFFYMPDNILSEWLTWTGMAIGFYYGLREVGKTVIALKNREK